MQFSQIAIGVIGLLLYLLLIRFITNHKNVQTKPLVEQQNLRRQLYLGLALVFVIYFGSQILINSKTTEWIPWLIGVCYLSTWGAGAYSILMAYRIGIRKEIGLLKKSHGQPIKDPNRFGRAVAVTDFLSGLSLCFLAVAIPIFKIKLSGWASLVFFIASIRNLLHHKIQKSDQ